MCDSIHRVPIARGVPDVLDRLHAAGFETSQVSRDGLFNSSPPPRLQQSLEEDPYAFEFSYDDSQFESVESTAHGSDDVSALLAQLTVRLPGGFTVSQGSAEVVCAFDDVDRSLFIRLHCTDFLQYSRQHSTASTVSRSDSLEVQTTSPRASTSDSDSADESDTSDSAGSDEEDAMNAHSCRSLALTLVDIADALQARKMRFLLDVSHDLFSDMFRTLLSIGFVARSKSGGLLVSKRQQLLAFDVMADKSELSPRKRSTRRTKGGVTKGVRVSRGVSFAESENYVDNGVTLELS